VPALGLNPPWDGVLVILADGARPDVMRSMADAGELSTIKEQFVDRGGFRDATSVFPTVSGPAHLPVLCGVHPGRANLPGIRWMERPALAGKSLLGKTRSYMAPFRGGKLERDVPKQVKTLFQHIPGMADVNTWFVRGCPGGARFTRFSKPAAWMRSLVTKDWYASDLQAERAVVRALDSGFTSISSVFPAVDELGHRFGPLCDESYESYRRFDAALGRIFDHLTRKGRVDRTLVMLTSDHGQSATHTHVDIDDLVRQVYPGTLVYPKLWNHLFSAEAAVMVSGNSLANVYLRGPGGWNERPTSIGQDSRPTSGSSCWPTRRSASSFIGA
jgi:predicted AlkP superfamily pyrophosphatase or phosphodiesterase